MIRVRYYEIIKIVLIKLYFNYKKNEILRIYLIYRAILFLCQMIIIT